MAVLQVIDRTGRPHRLDTGEGWRVMEIPRDRKVGVEGLRGGSRDGAAHHIVGAADRAERLPAARGEEIDALDGLTLTLPEAA